MKTKAPRSTPTTVSGPGGRRASISAPSSATRLAIWAAEMSSLGGDVGMPPTVPDRGPPVNGQGQPGAEPIRWGMRWDIPWNLAPPGVVPKTDEGAPADDETTLGSAADAARAPAPGRAKNDVTVVPPGAQVEQIEMDPIKIAAVKGPDGTHLETYDATELFERAGAALSEKRPADAARAYDQLLKEFPDTRYTKAALYNAGLAYEAVKDWQTAIARFSKLANEHADSSDAKDALFQIGACYAELGNWPTSATTFAQILERKDLNADDKIEAMGRRGYAQFQLKDLDTAERTFQSAVYYFNSIASEERLETDFYLGLVRYQLGEITHERFRAIQLRLPEKARSRPSTRRPGGAEREGPAAAGGPAPVHRDDQARQPAVGLGVRLPDRVALRGVLRRLRPRAHPRRAAGGGQPARSATSTTRSCARRSGSCSRSRSARTSRTS